MSIYRSEWIKFEDLLVVKGCTYVSALAVNNAYKTLERKSSSTEKQLLRDLKIKCCVTIKQPNNLTDQPKSCKTMILRIFKRYDRSMYLPVQELLTPKEGTNKQMHIELLRRIHLVPNVTSHYYPYDESIGESIFDYEDQDRKLSPSTRNSTG